ncbi:DUF6049 family protein [Sanguibacter massiliensis]|uniref:DUF6049 family protein n=1 Tax=Sanguibacter massiliensis TaxID=1973217 RepID=UPI00101AE544|nr:DUF6049 family protein [Sanguibacter massiliensis]
MAARRTGRPARGGRARMRGRAVLGATFVALLALGPLSLGTSSSSAAATAGPTAAGPRVVTEETAAVPAVVVTEVTPRSVGPDDTVSVSALLTNTTDTPLEKVHAYLGVVRYRLSSRQALRGWAAGEVTTADPTPVADLDLDLDEPLAPGASRTVTFTAPAADLRLLPYPETSGARGIVVTFSDDAQGRLGEGRGFLVWDPTADGAPVRLSVVVPVTGPAPDPTDPAAWTSRIDSETAEGGRLGAIVAGTAAHRGVSWVVDPALVERAAAGTPGTVAWASALLAGASGRDVFATDPFDPDLAALAAAGVEPLTDDRSPVAAPQEPDAEATAAASATATPIDDVRRAAASWRTDLALPAEGTASTEVLAAAAAAGPRLVVVDDGLEGVGSTTAPGSTAVATSSGDVTALVPDPHLDALFRSATSPLDPDLPTALAAANRDHDLMLLLAEIATVGEEPVAAQRHLLVTGSRTWTPDATALGHVLGTLESHRRIDLAPVSTLAGTPQPSSDRTPLPVTTSPVANLRTATVARAWDRVAEVRAFAGVTADPASLGSAPVATTSAALSVAWGSATTDRVRLLDDARAQVTAILGGISVVAGSDINLISDRGNLPIRVRNDLGVAVSVGVALVPDDPRLSVLDVPSATLEPGSEQNVQVPVRAIGSGDVSVVVRLTGPDGEVVAEPYAFDVRVRAEWETVGTGVMGGLLALLVLGGVVRTIRRGRSARRTAPIRPLEDA